MSTQVKERVSPDTPSKTREGRASGAHPETGADDPSAGSSERYRLWIAGILAVALAAAVALGAWATSDDGSTEVVKTSSANDAYIDATTNGGNGSSANDAYIDATTNSNRAVTQPDGAAISQGEVALVRGIDRPPDRIDLPGGQVLIVP